jgi:hypothetical protein
MILVEEKILLFEQIIVYILLDVQSKKEKEKEGPSFHP